MRGAFHLAEPTPRDVALVVDALRGSPFAYPDVGATRGDLPVGWRHGAHEAVVGTGAPAAQAAERALRGWRMFDLDWIRWHGGEAPQEEGQAVGFVARVFPVWTVNVCRVVYRVDEDDGAVRRAGFAYGTLAGHALCGEERFLLTHDRRTDVVTFAIRSFSRPSLPILGLALPWFTRVQRRFRLEATDRISRAARGS